MGVVTLGEFDDDKLRRVHERLDVLDRQVAVLEAHVADLRSDMRRVDTEHNATRRLLVELRADVKYIRERLDARSGAPDWPKIAATLIAIISTGVLIVMELVRRLP